MELTPFFEKYRNHFIEVIRRIQPNEVVKVVALLQEARQLGRTVFLAGNGGSAACCSHYAIDFLQAGQRSVGKPLRVVSLVDNVPVLTALSNDESYENIFVRQLEQRFSLGDVLVVLSASGNSSNLLRAVEYVNSCNGVSVGIVGFDGGQLKKICRWTIHIETSKGDYGPVEDAFMFLDHLITTYLGGEERL